MTFNSWQETVPATLKKDAVWSLSSYRHALCLAELCWMDVSKLNMDFRTRELCSQLYRAVGSVGANLAEGFSRGAGRDRARFYEYALSSARECRHWYFNAKHILGDAVTEHRLNLLSEIIRLTLTIIPQQRDSLLRDESVPYHTQEPEIPPTLMESIAT